MGGFGFFVGLVFWVFFVGLFSVRNTVFQDGFKMLVVCRKEGIMLFL